MSTLSTPFFAKLQFSKHCTVCTLCLSLLKLNKKFNRMTAESEKHSWNINGKTSPPNNFVFNIECTLFGLKHIGNNLTMLCCVLCTGEFRKRVRETSSQLFFTLYTLSIYPSAQLRWHLPNPFREFPYITFDITILSDLIFLRVYHVTKADPKSSQLVSHFENN